MATPTLSPEPLSRWRRLAIISLSAGAGFALMLSLIAGTVIWYTSRPTPPKPWDSGALVADGPPGFGASDDSKYIRFTYEVENRTDIDYQIESDSQIKVLAKYKSGAFSRPIPEEDKPLELPVFIPAKKKAALTIRAELSGMPAREPSESYEQYHERLRVYLEDHLSRVAEFAVFDDLNRYEISLPKWLPKAPKEP